VTSTATKSAMASPSEKEPTATCPPVFVLQAKVRMFELPASDQHPNVSFHAKLRPSADATTGAAHARTSPIQPTTLRVMAASS